MCRRAAHGDFQVTYASEESAKHDDLLGAVSQSSETARDGEKIEQPALYVVATPIGNLRDISLRALDVLRQVEVIFAEDTRSLRKLLRELGVQLNGRSIFSCHDHNEQQAAAALVGHLQRGASAALVSDAGTPLISDPGFAVLQLVRKELGQDFPVRPVPGPCATIAALSVAGVPTTRYLYAGFLTPKKNAKKKQLCDLLRQACSGAAATLVLYEAPHRILSTLGALAELLEEQGSIADRKVAVCRELTKRYETVLFGEAPEVLKRMESDSMQVKGEFVILIEGGRHSSEQVGSAAMSSQEIVQLLSAELPKSKAAHLAAKICGESKRALKKELFGRPMFDRV